MPKMTDHLRESFSRRRRPWDTTDLPPWWNLLVWASLGGIAVLLLIGSLPGGHSGTSRTGPAFAVQTLHPYATLTGSGPPVPAPSAGVSGAPFPAASAGAFAATAPVTVSRTGGGTAVVPAGARDTALAAATAEATGDWTGVPFAGAGSPAATARSPHGVVTGPLTVTDPAVTGGDTYLFSTAVSRDGGPRTHLVQITVERTPAGYAVRAAG